jgi:hypothetical protein
MPGLIDCHVHVMLSEVNIRYLEAIPLTMMTVRAAALMRGMIDRGFTTVRDTGGADWGMRDGVAQGHLPGPRMFIAGRALGPTGGHSDARRRTDVHSGACKCCNAMSFCLEVVDGADAVRAAVREQLRQGVDQIKIMVSGGVASPYDPLDSRQFSLAEIAAAVEEAALGLGAGPWSTFRHVILPLAMPGVIAGTILSFILAMNAYATPVLLGGPTFQMMGPTVYGQFAGLSNWPFGAALSFVLMTATLLLTVTSNWVAHRRYRR